MGNCLMVVVWLLLVLCPVPGVAINAGDYMLDAKKSLDKGENYAAVIQIKNALLMEPDNAEARLLLGTIYLEQRDGNSAEREILRARKSGIAKVQWLVPLGRTYLMLGRYDDILNEVTIEESYPDSLRANLLHLQGEAYLGKRRFSRADGKFTAALKVVSTHHESMLGMARIAYLTHDVEKATGYIEQVLANDPDNIAAWNMKGGLLSAIGEPEEAIEAFHQTLEFDENNIAARLGVTMANIASADIDAALSAIEKIRMKHATLYRSPQVSEIRYHLAVAMVKVGRKPEARSELEALLRSHRVFSSSSKAKTLLDQISEN